MCGNMCPNVVNIRNGACFIFHITQVFWSLVFCRVCDNFFGNERVAGQHAKMHVPPRIFEIQLNDSKKSLSHCYDYRGGFSYDNIRFEDNLPVDLVVDYLNRTFLNTSYEYLMWYYLSDRYSMHIEHRGWELNEKYIFFCCCKTYTQECKNYPWFIFFYYWKWNFYEVTYHHFQSSRITKKRVKARS